MDLILGQNDPHQGQPPAQVCLDHESNAGEPRLPTPGRHRDVLHASAGDKLRQFLRIAEHEGRTQRICRGFTGQAFEEVDFGRVGRRTLERGPDSHGQVPAPLQHSLHLPDR